MTREEAKGSLIAIKNKYLANYGEDSIINILIDEYDIQAIDVAIQALEQEPSDDLISRQAVLEKAVYTETEEGWWGYTVDVDYIKSLPSVKPQERTGHWIDTGSGQECSECHEIQYGYDNHRFYCGNCGARMEVEQNG